MPQRQTLRHILLLNHYSMNRILLAFLLFLPAIALCLPSSAQEQELEYDAIPLVAYWNEGDIFNYTVTKISRKWQNDSLSFEDSFSYNARFSVIEKLDSGYIVAWRYDHVSSMAQLSSQALREIYKDKVAEIVYRTDEFGGFVEILNWDEIGQLINQLIDEHIRVNSKSSGKSKVLKQTMHKIIKESLTTKESIQETLLSEINLFHGYFGSEYYTKDTVVFETEVPTIFDNTSIRANGIGFFEFIDWESSFGSMVAIAQSDTADVNQFLKQFFQKMGLSKREIDNYLSESNMDIIETSKFQAWFNPGVPYYIGFQRFVETEMPTQKTAQATIIHIELEQ